MICCIDVPFKSGFTIYGWFTAICCIDIPFKTGLTVYMVGLPRFVVYNKSWQANHIYSQICLKGYIYTINRGKQIIYTVKPALKGTSIQQIVVNQPYIRLYIWLVYHDLLHRCTL
jgi:hypothetical protein